MKNLGLLRYLFTPLEQVLFRFLEVFFLLFPPHFSSQKSLPQNKRRQILYTDIVLQSPPASVRTIDQRRNLSPVKGTNQCQQRKNASIMIRNNQTLIKKKHVSRSQVHKIGIYIYIYIYIFIYYSFSIFFCEVAASIH